MPPASRSPRPGERMEEERVAEPGLRALRFGVFEVDPVAGEPGSRADGSSFRSSRCRSSSCSCATRRAGDAGRAASAALGGGHFRGLRPWRERSGETTARRARRSAGESAVHRDAAAARVSIRRAGRGPGRPPRPRAAAAHHLGRRVGGCRPPGGGDRSHPPPVTAAHGPNRTRPQKADLERGTHGRSRRLRGRKAAGLCLRPQWRGQSGHLGPAARWGRAAAPHAQRRGASASRASRRTGRASPIDRRGTEAESTSSPRSAARRDCSPAKVAGRVSHPTESVSSSGRARATPPRPARAECS